MALSDIVPVNRKEEFLQAIADKSGAPVPVTRIEEFLKRISETPSLPAVTSDDNGDFLGVVDGEWAKSPAPSSLPPYTSADKGKVLTVGEAEPVETEVEVVPEQTVQYTGGVATLTGATPTTKVPIIGGDYAGYKKVGAVTAAGSFGYSETGLIGEGFILDTTDGGHVTFGSFVPSKVETDIVFEADTTKSGTLTISAHIVESVTPSTTTVVVPEQTVTAVGQTTPYATIENCTIDWSSATSGDSITLSINGTPYTANYDYDMFYLPAFVAFSEDTPVGAVALRDDVNIFLTLAPGEYTISATASVPSVGPKWESVAVYELPQDVVTAFTTLATSAIMAAVTANDYLPHYADGSSTTMQTDEYDSFVNFVKKYVSRANGYLSFNGSYIPVSLTSLLDGGDSGALAWFTLPFYGANGNFFSMSIKLLVFPDSQDLYDFRLSIIVQQLKTADSPSPT